MRGDVGADLGDGADDLVAGDDGEGLRASVLQPDLFISAGNGLGVEIVAGWSEGGTIFAGPSHERVAAPLVVATFRAVRPYEHASTNVGAISRRPERPLKRLPELR
jgi:hypothetical protein